MTLSRPTIKIAKFVAIFLLGAFVTAQDLPNSRRPNISEPLGQSEKPRTRVDDPEIVGNTQGVDFQPYLEASVLPMIRATWYRLALKSKETTGGDATLEFTILKDGSVADVKLTDGAGHAALGDLAMDAVRKSSPFASLPAQFGGQAISLRCRFYYQPASKPPGDAATGLATGSGRTVTVNGVEEPVYKVGKGITVPRTTYNPEPEFSEEARKKGIEGVVVLTMVVTSEGNTDQIKVTNGIGHGLDEKAVQAVSQWKFQPATKDGKPVSVEIAVEVSFHSYHRP
jgi:TonB family protein